MALGFRLRIRALPPEKLQNNAANGFLVTNATCCRFLFFFLGAALVLQRIQSPA